MGKTDSGRNRRNRCPVACAVALFGAVLAVPSATVRSASSAILAAIPAHAKLLLVTALAGQPTVYAVAYLDRNYRIGVVAPGDGMEHLRWSSALAGAPATLASPGPPGVFLAVVHKSLRYQELYAFRFHNQSVESALAGQKAGHVAGTAGLHVYPTSFVIRSVDATHVGAVHYRYQTLFTWTGARYSPVNRVHVPDYPPGGQPYPNVKAKSTSGDVTLLKVEVADTEQDRQTGLMNRKSMDPDSGMVFVWQQDVVESFWMENTYIPLSVAFISADGNILDIQDMEPLSTTLHSPPAPYRYAVEANQGYFSRAGIRVGDHLSLHLKAS